MTLVIPDATYRRIPVADGVSLNVAVAGTGSPVILLHGFPQTHLMWRHVVADLMQDHTVIVPDLRGYGDSDKPAELDATTYSKRTMGDDVVALAAALGHDTFALVGHDRGALVAFRTAMDHPENVTHLTSLDVLPTLDMWDVLHGANAAVGFHLYLMAQPPGLAETMISNSADVFFGHFLDAWTKDPAAIPAEYRLAYLAASAGAVPSIVADYRATASIDIAHDQADLDLGTTLSMPVTVIQQDWGSALGYDAAAVWRAWAPRLTHYTTDAGHFMAEEVPAEIVAAVRELLAT
ncbi:Pimeloyl-ACP methyl ester carboxylesterase [Sanguibacter gelidistatuariae]|uniref:Pimeloyl-ACP methyl ester carboxylesterase n=1 Tax=Sanguibacter gelidistatuariae TaxID=1814289 RepID=A0A1G6S5X4_9MICO|nr:alpha/beta hydrolase [Sanguibacter gelidistatuariae]SDD11596.1 Pimeloyl-ACP methyl ester carboxylesterase [Sanguibacter gelidistatuariae]